MERCSRRCARGSTRSVSSDACLRAWRAARGAGGSGAGDRVELLDFLPYFVLQRQSPAFKAEPTERNFRGYSRARFAFDVLRLRNEGGLSREGWRMNLGVATGTTATKKNRALFFENEHGDGEFKLTVFFTRAEARGMNALQEMTPELAQHVLDRMGTTGQPPERGAQHVNVATGELLDVLRDEYLRPMKASGRGSTFKLVQAPFGGGKTHFLHCLRELGWTEGFATSLIGLSPKECPFDRPVSIYREVARKLELPVEELDVEPSQGLERVLRQVARERVEEGGEEAFLEWLRSEFTRANIESRAFSRAVRAFLEAIVTDDLDAEEVLADYLLGEDVPRQELQPFRLREALDDESAFRWLRSLVQCLAALGLPGIVLMFDEMDRNMSLSVAPAPRHLATTCGR